MSDTTTPTWPKPTNVIEALAQVQARIGGIQKLTPAERRRMGISGGTEAGQGVSYAYRGVDQVTAAAQPLFGELGIVIVPVEIVDLATRQVEVGQHKTIWDHHVVTVHWAIYGPGGITDMIEAESVGEGRDNSDKGINKAYTGAYKNLLLKLLSIGDPSEDPDTERHDNSDDRDEAPPADLTEQQAAAAAISKLNGADKALVNKLAKEAGITNVMRAGDRAGDLLDIIANLHKDEAAQAEPDPQKDI